MEKKKEFIQYILWGVFSMVLNVVLFRLLILFNIDYRVSNAVTLVFVKIICYITNKIFVFHTPFTNTKAVLRELGKYTGARSITFLIDFFGTILLVEILKCGAFISKCIMTLLVVAINYILSEIWVFKDKVVDK